MTKKLISLLLFLFPIIAFSQTINPGGSVTVSCATCPSCPPPIIIHDTVKTNTTLIVHDTVKINQTIIIHDSVCPTVPPVVTPPPTTSGYTVLYSNGYDTKSDINSNQLGKGSISTTVFKFGTGSFKSVVNYGDIAISSGYRSEQQYSISPLEGQYDWWEMVESWDHPGWGASLGIQLHPGNNDNGGSALFFMEGCQKLFNVYFWKKGYQTDYAPSTCMPINPGQWYHLTVNYKWSQKSDGYFTVYIDGKQYWTYSGITQAPSGDVPYPKLGQNNYPSNTTAPHGMTAYFDNFSISKKN